MRSSTTLFAALSVLGSISHIYAAPTPASRFGAQARPHWPRQLFNEETVQDIAKRQPIPAPIPEPQPEAIPEPVPIAEPQPQPKPVASSGAKFLAEREANPAPYPIPEANPQPGQAHPTHPEHPAHPTSGKGNSKRTRLTQP